ncbi:MAG TPA: DUF892 family protein [Micromonosporaceae bacterium]
MAIETPRELFVYELGLTRNLERMGDHMLSDVAHTADNRDLVRILHEEEESRYRQAANIDACLAAVGLSPLDQRAAVVEGLRERFFNFVGMDPSPAIRDLYVIGTALRFTNLVISAYRELLDLAVLAAAHECRQPLQANLSHKEQYVEKLNWCRRELAENLAATV